VCRDIESDPKFRIWQQEALQRDYGSSLALPLYVDGEVIGALNIYAMEPDAFDEDELELLTELSNDLANGIDSIRRSQQDKERYMEQRKDCARMEKRQVEMEAALEKARESEKLKSTFLANLSHEIRTPMNAILGFSELLAQENLTPPRQTQYADIVNSKGKQLLRMLDDIVNISRIQSNQVENNPLRFNLNALFSELEIFYRKKLEEEQRFTRLVIRMKTSLEDSLAHIRLDRGYLEQVLTHLINNALKFTSEGFVEVGYLPHNSDQLLFYVQDSGLGIAKEKHAVIFELFRQADEGGNRNYGGIGLGLTIAKKLVEVMGGSIWVESEPDSGSTFFFTTPLVSDNGDDESPMQEGAIDDEPEISL
jgi:signal transduction histidine kinase